MKFSLLLVCFLASLFAPLASCDQDAAVPGNADAGDTTDHNPPTLTESQMKIKIGTQTFTATLADNATATAFKALLPMTVAMVELNGNEKYVDLPSNLPANASNPGTIQNGDLMLYGANTLVLFYKSFSTSYRYTRLGRIDDPAGLAAAVGSGNVSVTFALP
jgi:hypothetical protein